MPPVGWIGSSSRRRIAPSRSGGSIAARFSATVAPVTVSASPCSSPASSSARMTTGTPPTRSTALITCAPNGLTSARCGTRSPTRVKSSRSSGTPASWAIASRCSTAFVDPPKAMTTAMAFSNASRVRICRAVIPFSSIADDRLAGCAGDAVAAPVDRGWARRAGQRHAQRLGRARHRVRGVHAAAGALARADRALDGVDLLAGDQAARAGPDRLERVGDVHLPLAHVPGQDRPGVDEHRREVQARRGHEHAGQALVAAGEQHGAVEPLGLHDGLHRVGDDLAADQREVHPDVAHRDAVGHRDRAELHRVAARPVHALLGRLREALQRQVARGDLVPGRGDADLRLGEVLVAHADRAEHPARGGALESVGDLAGAGLEVVRGGVCVIGGLLRCASADSLPVRASRYLRQPECALPTRRGIRRSGRPTCRLALDGGVARRGGDSRVRGR